MLTTLFAAEIPQDPTWLRLLATVLPVVGTILVALLTGPRLLERVREKRAERTTQSGASPTTIVPPIDGPGVPTPVTVAVTEKASLDPVLRLFIDDLHTRLSMAHEEAAELHRLRAVDAGTIARLTAEIADKEERLVECESELTEKRTQSRSLMRRLEELKEELDATRRRLAICKEMKS